MSGSDPFSMAAGSLPQTGLPSTDPSQGMLGVAPSTWQTIGRLGSGMIAGANARTADGHLANGTGFAGGFGAGVNSALDDQQHQAILRSSLGQRAEETQGLHMQNQLNLMQMPVARQRALLQQAYMHQMMQGGMGGGMSSDDAGGSVWGGGGGISAPPPGVGASAAPAAAGGYAGTVNGPLEGGAGQNPNSTASGYGQLIDSQKIAFANANPQYFQGATGWDDVKGRFADPQVGTAATQWMAQQNAPVLARYGVQPTGPNLAMAHRLGPVAGAAVAQAPDNLPIAQVLATSIGPEKAQQYVQANPTWGNQTAGQFRAGFANVPDYGPATQQGGSYVGQADQLMRQAALLEHQQQMAKYIGVPGPAGDPAMLRQAAQQYRGEGLKLQSAGPAATASSNATNQSDLAYKPAIAGATADATNRSDATFKPYTEGRIAAEKANVDIATAGEIERQKTLGNRAPITDRFGNMYQRGDDGQMHFLGRGSEVKEVWNDKAKRYDYGEVGGIGVGDVKNLSGPAGAPPGGGAAPPGAGGMPGQQGALPPGGGGVAPEDGAQAAKPGPMYQHFAEHRGGALGKDFEDTDEAAAAAKDSNYLFDNMRTDAQTWDMGKFAAIEGDARAWLSAVAQSFGVKTPELNEKLADYQAFNKSSGQLLRSAVHDTSSRAAVQEYKLIGDSLPQPTTSRQAFGQVADQWQGMNDFRLAKQKFMQGYQDKPEKFEVEFNSRVSPTAFMLNRMSQSPEGQQTLAGLIHRMQDTPEGRLAISRMKQGYNYAKQNGLFDDLAPAGAPPPPPPSPGQ